jgi:predicted Zn-dependent peptidase
LWGDQYALGYTRSLADRLQEIEAVQFDEVNNWLAQRVYGELTFVAVGPEPINLDETALLL